ncbi:competence/damage-inducible protein A [Chloroflexota bacterium]
MKAEIISIGTELLLGEITDDNAPYLASQLPPLGIDLYWISVAGDNPERLLEVLQRAWQRSDLILTTGGLGPTEADITRQAIATLLGEEMSIDAGIEKEMREFFARRGAKMPLSNLKQATIVPSSRSLHNLLGTAPGWWVEKEGHLLIALPGPPHETRRMWDSEVLPLLRERAGGAVILSRILKTLGLSEAAVNEKVKRHLQAAKPTLGIYVKPDGIHLRITAKAETKAAAQELISRREGELRQALGNYIWGVDGETLEAIVGRLLLSRGLTLATMESCTGGLLSSTITDTPGSSDYFKGSIVSYTPETKTLSGINRQLIERFGTVSPEAAEAMASATCSLMKADIGVGITGVAGPGTIEDKPVGTVYISISGLKAPLFSARFPGNRTQVKRRATLAALNELRKALLE